MGADLGGRTLSEQGRWHIAAGVLLLLAGSLLALVAAETPLAGLGRVTAAVGAVSLVGGIVAVCVAQLRRPQTPSGGSSKTT